MSFTAVSGEHVTKNPIVTALLALSVSASANAEATDWTPEERRRYEYHERKREAFARKEMANFGVASAMAGSAQGRRLPDGVD